MRGRSAVGNRLEFCLAACVLKSLEWSPLPVAHLLARGYARLLDLALPRLRMVGNRNLAFALPEANAGEIVDGVFRSIARLLVAFAKFPSIAKGNVRSLDPLRGRGALRERFARRPRSVSSPPRIWATGS